MAQHHYGAIQNDSLLRLGPRTLRLFDVMSTYDIRKTYCQSINAEIMLCWHWMLYFWKNAPCVECMDKGLCFLLKHRNIIATAYWILLLKPSFLISQGQQCWHTFHALMSAKNKRPIKYVKPKLTPLYFHSSYAWYAWLLYNKIQQFFLKCAIMHECNNNFAFPSHSSIYTAILKYTLFLFSASIINVRWISNFTYKMYVILLEFILGKATKGHFTTRVTAFKSSCT